MVKCISWGIQKLAWRKKSITCDDVSLGWKTRTFVVFKMKSTRIHFWIHSKKRVKSILVFYFLMLIILEQLTRKIRRGRNSKSIWWWKHANETIIRLHRTLMMRGYIYFTHTVPNLHFLSKKSTFKKTYIAFKFTFLNEVFKNIFEFWRKDSKWNWIFGQKFDFEIVCSISFAKQLVFEREGDRERRWRGVEQKIQLWHNNSRRVVA